MNSAVHLRPEDRAEFERILDDTLRSRTPSRPGAHRPTREQLRTLALGALGPITACAAAEYAEYVRLRDAQRRREGEAEAEERGRLSLAGAVGEGLTESSGAGLLAVVSVLTPLLAGAAAVIFLLVGYTLRLLTPEPALAGPMRDAGWVFAAIAAAGVVVAMAGLLLTALRNGPGARAEERPSGRVARRRGGDTEARTRAALEAAAQRWREALRTRGVEPFLDRALAVGGAGVQGGEAHGEGGEEGRLARLGYDGPAYTHPGFSSPASSGADDGGTHLRPRFTSPDFSSPDYGGPDHPPQ